MVRLLPLYCCGRLYAFGSGVRPARLLLAKEILRPLANLGLEIKYVYVKVSEEARSLPKTELAGLFWVSVAMADTQRYVFMN